MQSTVQQRVGHTVNQVIDWFSSKDYKFYVQSEPASIQTNCNIVTTCYTSRNKEAIVPCRYSWYRVKNGVTAAIPGVKGSTYMCEPSDVGCLIKAQITSLDQQHSGTAMIEFGPVKIDFLTRKNIQFILSAKQGRFPVTAISDGQERPVVLTIHGADDFITLEDPTYSTSFKFSYNVADPRFQQHAKDNTKLVVTFTEKHQSELNAFTKILFNKSVTTASSLTDSRRLPGQSRLELKFDTRTTKDMFFYSYKAFVGRREAKTQQLINKIQNTNLNNQNEFQYSLEIQSLKDDMVRLLKVKSTSQKDKESYKNEVKRLEEEMEAIILTYTKIVEDKCKNQDQFDKSYVYLSDKKEEVLGKKQKALEAENKELTDRIRALTEELQSRGIKVGQPSPGMPNSGKKIFGSPSHSTPNFKKQSAPFEEIDAKMEEISNINIRLAAENDRLKFENSAMQREQHNKSMESILESLNESKNEGNPAVQKLNQSVRQLEKQLEQAQKKNQELEKVLSQSQHLNRSGRLDMPLIQTSPQHQSAFIDDEVRRTNDKLARDNKKLQELRNVDQSNMQILQAQVSRLKDEVHNMSMNNSRHHHSAVMDLESHNLRKELESVGAIKNALQSKCDELIRENAKLRSSMVNTGPAPANNTTAGDESVQLRAQINHLVNLLHEKDSIIKQLQTQNAALRDQVHNSSKTDNTAKYKKKIEELLQENKMLRKGQNVLNKSRDLSMSMDSYLEQESNAIKEQNRMLVQENEKLTKMCEKYLKDAKEATKMRLEIIQLKKEIESLRKPEVSMTQ